MRGSPHAAVRAARDPKLACMKTKVLRRLLLGALSLGALLAQSAPAAPNPVTGSATGSGHMVRPDGTFRSFSFSARKYADGSVDGQLQLNSNPAEGEIGELNRAIVRDNGEGHGVIDQVSRIPANPGSVDERTCLDENEDLFPLRDVQRGNVQVRGD